MFLQPDTDNASNTFGSHRHIRNLHTMCIITNLLLYFDKDKSFCPVHENGFINIGILKVVVESTKSDQARNSKSSDSWQIFTLCIDKSSYCYNNT